MSETTPTIDLEEAMKHVIHPLYKDVWFELRRRVAIKRAVMQEAERRRLARLTPKQRKAEEVERNGKWVWFEEASQIDFNPQKPMMETVRTEGGAFSYPMGMVHAYIGRVARGDATDAE